MLSLIKNCLAIHNQCIVQTKLNQCIHQVLFYILRGVDAPRYYSKSPNILITAIAGEPPSRAFVWPQYAMTYFEGCQVTVGDGARAGTRCNGTPVSVAHWKIKMRNKLVVSDESTNDINIIPCVGDSKKFAVMRETERIDTISRGGINQLLTTMKVWHETNSHEVIVRAQIQSFKSNILTIESYPPEARYLLKYQSHI